MDSGFTGILEIKINITRIYRAIRNKDKYNQDLQGYQK
jgi:hypothetical protein